MGFNLNDLKNAAEKAVDWGKEHPEEVKKGVDAVKDILPKLKK